MSDRQPLPDCLAYVSGACDGDFHAVIGGVPLCKHHAEKADIYDYPRQIGEVAAVQKTTEGRADV